ncbi:MAG: hypothetical protein IKM24_04335 [Clostridia bacterium]|nr:hypothetical protein [Clostridia bacterium]
MMKVIFLDIDGVLNGPRYVRSCGHFGVVIDPARLHLLKQITDVTGAVIVLATSWREHWNPDANLCDDAGRDINAIFSEVGLSVFGKTPKLQTGRTDEICAWLDANPQVKNFVVLDDAFMQAAQLDGHIVRTSNLRGGLDERNVIEAIRILNEN